MIVDCAMTDQNGAKHEKRPIDPSRFDLESSERWFVAMTAPRKERLAATQLDNQHYRSFLPLQLETRRHARKFTTVLAPVFPRYLFVILDVDRQRWRSVNGTLGVQRLITDGEPETRKKAILAVIDRLGVDYQRDAP